MHVTVKSATKTYEFVLRKESTTLMSRLFVTTAYLREWIQMSPAQWLLKPNYLPHRYCCPLHINLGP